MGSPYIGISLKAESRVPSSLWVNSNQESKLKKAAIGSLF